MSSRSWTRCSKNANRSVRPQHVRATATVGDGPCQNACTDSPGLVGDGLVPSRSEFMQDADAGDHKGRPYMLSVRAARPR